MLEQKLCNCCRVVISTNDKQRHDHHASAEELFAAAAGGCPLCTVLGDCFRRSSFHENAASGELVKFNFAINEEFSTERRAVMIRFKIYFPNRLRKGAKKALPQEHVLQDILIIPVTDGEAEPVGQRISTTNTGSDEAWAVAMHWLDQCNRTHSKCRPANQRDWRPTRLLDVGTSDCPCLHLDVTDNNCSAFPCTFITLSHCWGKMKIKTLTKDGLASMVKGIDVTDLPKTFQDTVSITRRLGVRFLWIDSLCIIQDSEEDWARESSLMGNVYQNGICNIAATAAPDGNAGCFMERDPILAQRCRLRINKALSKFGLKTGIYDLVPEKLWEDGVSNAPLNRRAWVVQERILAPRVLHFGRSQLFWECIELDACEIYPDGLPDALSKGAFKSMVLGVQEYGFKKSSFKNLDPEAVRTEAKAVTDRWNVALIKPPPSGQLVDPYYVWNKVLLAYTNCALTQDQDKLVAISAIAKQIKLMGKDEYLAGLWSQYLPYHLLWAADQQDKNRMRSPKYCAPSWSWASIKGRVEPYVSVRPDHPAMIKVLEASVQTKTSNLMGQVTDGHLKVQGWLRRLSIIEDTEGSVFRINVGHSAPGFLPMSFAQFDENKQSDDHEWWFLPVLSLGSWMQSMAMGLILAETGNEDAYRRVGMFTAYDDSARTFRRPTYPIQPTQSFVTEGTGSRVLVHDVQRNIIDKTKSSGAKLFQSPNEGDTTGVATNYDNPSRASQENRNKAGLTDTGNNSRTVKNTSLGKDKETRSFWKWNKTNKKDRWEERVIIII